jgi:hypothetical protein
LMGPLTALVTIGCTANVKDNLHFFGSLETIQFGN